MHGNVLGLSQADKHRVERIYRRRVPVHDIVSHDLAKELAEAGHTLHRRVGVLVDRAGRIEAVAIGDARRVDVPRQPSAPSGRDRFCTLRWIATKDNDEPLTATDLSPLALHRLDALAIVAVEHDGAPGPVRVAHLLPAEERERRPSKETKATLPPGIVVPRGLQARPAPRQREIEDVVADGERYRLFPPRPASLVDDDFLDLIGALEAEFERTRKRTKVSGKAGRAILVHVTTGSRLAAEESMDELEELAASSGLGVVDRIVQRRQHFDPRTLMGAGRLEDLIILASRLQADYIVVDQNLTPAQARAIAESTAIKVIDRSQLILDIFARRARTHEGKIQVELAQLKYLLSRLMSHGDSGLSRLEGGIGGRGPGEQKLEVDRRRVRDRIKSLEKMLHGERTRREQRRARRSERDVPVVSIVGYTNAGKSTLLNVVTKSEVFVEQRMFATLEEIRDSNLLVHLVDMAHPRHEAQIKAVEQILEELGDADIPRLLVFNKADLVEKDRHDEILDAHEGSIAIAAAKRVGLTELLRALDDGLRKHRKVKLA